MDTTKLTWEKMVELDPRFQELYERACSVAVHDEYVADVLWFGIWNDNYRFGFKHSMSKLAGAHRVIEDHLILSMPKAYDIAYRKIYDALWLEPNIEMDDSEMQEILNRHLHHNSADDGFGEMRPTNPMLE